MGIQAAGSNACPASSSTSVPNLRSRSNRSAAPHQGAAHDLCAVEGALCEKSLQLVGFLAQGAGFCIRLPARRPLVRPKGAEFLLGFPHRFFCLPPVCLDLFEVGIGLHQAVHGAVDHGRVDAHGVADARDFEAGRPQTLHHQVDGGVGRRGTHDFFAAPDQGLDKLHQGGRLSGPGRTMHSGHLVRREGVTDSCALRGVEAGVFKRLWFGRLWPGITQQDLPQCCQAAGLAIGSCVEDFRKGLGHFLETAFVETGIQRPHPMGRLLGQIVAIQYDLCFQSARRPHNAPEGHGIPFVVIGRQLHGSTRPEGARLSGIGLNFQGGSAPHGVGGAHHVDRRP